MDILNFISWIKGGRYSTTIPTNAVTVVGVPNPNRDDKYLPVTVPVSSFGGGSNIGKLLGGGIVVSEWDEYGVKKCLIASLTDIGTTLVWTTPAFQFGPRIGITAESVSNGFTNTNAIITQTGAAPTTLYAAGAARLHNGGGYNDWYLPSMFELLACYNSSDIVNKVLGDTNGFCYCHYWSSTEVPDINGVDQAKAQLFDAGYGINVSKASDTNVRAVRIHTL